MNAFSNALYCNAYVAVACTLPAPVQFKQITPFYNKLIIHVQIIAH